MDTGIIILIVVGLLVYFIPTIIGWKTKYVNGIFVLNFFLGWTLLGWVGALIWAVSAPKEFNDKSLNEANNKGLAFWVSGIRNIFFTPSGRYQPTDSKIILLINKLNQGEAIIKDKMTNELMIVTAEQWSNIVSNNNQDRFEIIEEK